MDLEAFLKEWNNDSPTVLVHTSGSTGEPKPMLVEKKRMEASARITCEFLGLKKGDCALLCMPLDYIAGKMMVVRALVQEMQLLVIEPSGHPMQHIPSDARIDFAAMVPLQVYNTLQVAEERQRLMEVRHLIIGGGAVDDAMARELNTFPNAVWSTYGMTETLSHVALRRLNGSDVSEWYSPFPSVSLSLTDDNCLVIDAPLVCAERLITHDVAELSPDGRFRILGRKDNVICSGGIKIQMEEVERLLRPYLASPYLITKRKDEKFGEIVVLLTEGNINDAATICRLHLPKHWQPHCYLHVDRIPLTGTGKPARGEAQILAKN